MQEALTLRVPSKTGRQMWSSGWESCVWGLLETEGMGKKQKLSIKDDLVHLIKI